MWYIKIYLLIYKNSLNVVYKNLFNGIKIYLMVNKNLLNSI